MQRQESSPMEKLAAVKCSVAAEAGPRSDFLWPSDTDTVLSIVMALAGEVATLYERVDTIERVVEQELGLSRAKLDAFVPSSAAPAERGRSAERPVGKECVSKCKYRRSPSHLKKKK